MIGDHLNFLPGTIVVITCNKSGSLQVVTFGPESINDALRELDTAFQNVANWGKCFEVRARDGKYIFHSEFQQRT